MKQVLALGMLALCVGCAQTPKTQTGSAQCDATLAALQKRDTEITAIVAAPKTREDRRTAAIEAQSANNYFEASLPQVAQFCNPSMASLATAEVRTRILELNAYIAKNS